MKSISGRKPICDEERPNPDIHEKGSGNLEYSVIQMAPFLSKFRFRPNRGYNEVPPPPPGFESLKKWLYFLWNTVKILRPAFAE